MSLKKGKKIVFTEEIDSSIGGFSLGIAFVLVSVFVIYFKIFNNLIAERIVAIVLLVIGIVGTLTELGKIKKDDIKGGDDLLTGFIVTGVSVVTIFKVEWLLCDILSFLFLLIGAFGTIKGIIEIIYSLKLMFRENRNRKKDVMKIIVALTQVLALVVVILQLIGEVQ